MVGMTTDHAAVWRREHPRTYQLTCTHSASDTASPDDSFPRAIGIGRAGTRDPRYWSNGRVRPEDTYWVFYITIRGQGLVTGRGREWLVGPGQAVLLRADDPATTIAYPPAASAWWEWAWLEYAGHAANVMSSALVAKHGPIYDVSANDPPVRWLLQATTTAGGRTLLPWDAREQVWRMLNLLEATAEPAGAPAGLVRSARRVLAEHANDRELSTSSVAGILGISREHLTRSFRAATGTTPRMYVESLRVRQAERLLRMTLLPLEVIARRCGWRDVDTFASAFRRTHGESPGRWRNR